MNRPRTGRAALLLAILLVMTTASPALAGQTKVETIPFGHAADISLHYETPPPPLLLSPATMPVTTGFKHTTLVADFLRHGNQQILLQTNGDLILFTQDGVEQHRLQLGQGAVSHLMAVANQLYAFGEKGIHILQIEDSKISSLARWDSPSPITAVQYHKDKLYAIDNNQYLHLLSLQANRQNVHSNSYYVGKHLFGLAVQGNYALLAAGHDGLLVVDVRQADAIEMVDSFFTSGLPHDIFIENAVAYVADGPMGFTVLDVSEPLAITYLGSNHKSGPVYRIKANANYLVGSNNSGDLFVVDRQNPWQPKLVGSQFTGVSLLHFQLQQDTVQVSTDNKVLFFDISDPALPAISSVGVNLGGSRRAQIVDDLLYVADWFSGLHIYDIHDPANIQHRGNFHTDGSSKGVLVDGNIAYVGDDDHGLQVISVEQPQNPRRLAKIGTTGLAYTMKKVDQLLYVADHRGGLHIIDISQAQAPQKLSSFDTEGKSWAVDVSGDTAYVADDNAGILVFDVSDPARPVLLERFHSNGQAEDIIIRDNIAFAAFFDRGLYLLDISEPRQPRLLSRLPIPGNARGIALQGNLAYIAAWDAGLQVVDISDLENPRIIGHLDTDGSTWGVNVNGPIAYLLDWWGGVKTVNISDPTRPRLISRYQARDVIHNLALQGHYAYLASGDSGVQIFDIRNPINPIWVTGSDLKGSTLDLALFQQQLYAITEQGWVYPMDITNPFQIKSLTPFNTGAQLQQVLATASHLVLRSRDQGVLLLPISAAGFTAPPVPLQVQAQSMTSNADYLILATPTALSFRELKQVQQTNFSHPVSEPVTHMAATEQNLLTINQEKNLKLYQIADQQLKLLAQTSLVSHDIKAISLLGKQVYVSTRRGLLTLGLGGNGELLTNNFYPTVEPIGPMQLSGNNVFFAGATVLSSVQLLPEITIRHTGKQVTLQFPKNLPLGKYQIKTLGGRIEKQVNVQLLKPKRPRLNKEMFKRMMKSTP